MDLSLVIPVYNSAHLIPGTVERLTGVLKPLNIKYEILLRNDGSSDRSREIMEEVSARYPEVRCFHNDGNRGLGYTLRHLFADARGSNVIYLDCDLPFGVNILNDVLARLKQYDIVVCSRYMGKRNTVAWPRKMASRMYYFLCRVLFDIPVNDIGSGTVGFKREALTGLDLFSDGFAVHAEIFWKARLNRCSIDETGVEADDSGRGIGHMISYCVPVLAETLSLKVSSKRPFLNKTV